ncbi:DUF1223 domain-containing protein [Paenirhodobacter hankyongi]|nr:DUF1223 domain-containing protein [Sinirhodobacter hankyongi]
MALARAIIGTAAGGWLALTCAAVCGTQAFAQGMGAANGPGPGPGPGTMVSPPPIVLADAGTTPGAGTGAGGTTGGTPAPGTLSGPSLIENLNEALENALEKARVPDAMSLMARTVTPEPSRGPVVVELFTSQGCSACPPADELLAKIADRPDVIALSLHVDYWDYLGWEDPFAQPAFTARQKAYARAARSRTIFTPQMIIEGEQSLVAPSEAELEQMIAREYETPDAVALSVSGSKGNYQIELRADPPLPQNAVVQIVRFAPQARVEILRGENAGMVLDYANVVTAWHAVADWDGRTPTRLNAKIDGDEPAVVIVQGATPGKSAPLPGPILAAARLN